MPTAAAGVIIGALALAGVRPQAHTKISQVTWTVDVEPILRRRCLACHSTEGVGALPLVTYDEARASAGAIRDEVLSGRMPPWQARRGFGDFTNDASLTTLELDLLASWTDGNTPLGPPLETRESRSAATVSPESLPFDLPGIAVGEAAERDVELATHESQDKWIVGWTFEPGIPSLVESATLSIGPSTVGSWTQFDSTIRFPEGVAERLPAGAALRVHVRYDRTSEPRTDRSRLVLYLGEQGSELQHRAIACGSTTFDRPATVLSVTPHAGAAGESVEVVAQMLDRAIQPLVVVPRFHPRYAISYWLRNPLRLRQRRE